MIDFPGLSDIVDSSPSKIVMLVVDGLGGVPHPDTGRSELETAYLPNLDRLAQISAGGRTIPVLPGVTPGSGPGHLALFGYDPLKYFIGRGVLEALGIGAPLRDGDLAARGNFCSIDRNGILTDRRAGRIPSSESFPIVETVLSTIEVPNAELVVLPVQDYRFVLIAKGDELRADVTGTDPQRNGATPLSVIPIEPGAQKTADVINTFVAQARELLSDQPKANMLMLRGFSKLPSFPSFAQTYKLSPAAIAAYPMYRGLAQVVGMEVIGTGNTFGDEIRTLQDNYGDHDFFYIHYKHADAAGEDGDFDAKVKALEDLDTYIPQILDLEPDVFIVAGDHASPAIMAAHGWQPVPLLVHSNLTIGDGIVAFNERACLGGSLGTIEAQHLMLLALSHAGKLAKYGP
ncbi:MAG: 2,3-bisphosphoglycerate-independent phosphoglycerate mutase [Chloroflexota bacterium]|nr:2,3-bisphosphoglycerate-independent phosphoglycerate mutase [Chloroflexota bacterium]